jgi:hypothetical protein
MNEPMDFVNQVKSAHRAVEIALQYSQNGHAVGKSTEHLSAALQYLEIVRGDMAREQWATNVSSREVFQGTSEAAAR